MIGAQGIDYDQYNVRLTLASFRPAVATRQQDRYGQQNADEEKSDEKTFELIHWEARLSLKIPTGTRIRAPSRFSSRRGEVLSYHSVLGEAKRVASLKNLVSGSHTTDSEISRRRGLDGDAR